MIEVSRYSDEDRDSWNSLVRSARNGHFMFLRDYMEYHGDRFEDHSLVFRYKDTPLAVLPANLAEGVLSSHAGLSFGGMISGPRMTAGRMLDAFSALDIYCKQNGIGTLHYAAIPHIYHIGPACEDLYALARNGAQLIRRDLTTTLDQSTTWPYSGRRKRNISKGKRAALEIVENRDFSHFWKLLSKVLLDRHGISPVHSLGEITHLASLFSDNIRLYEARAADGELLAGTVLYITERVVHTQYLANSEAGRNSGALDYLLDHLITSHRDTPYFDLGISTTHQGRELNEGLCLQKEGFGARAIVHDFYTLDFE